MRLLLAAALICGMTAPAVAQDALSSNQATIAKIEANIGGPNVPAHGRFCNLIANVCIRFQIESSVIIIGNTKSGHLLADLGKTGVARISTTFVDSDAWLSQHAMPLPDAEVPAVQAEYAEDLDLLLAGITEHAPTPEAQPTN